MEQNFTDKIRHACATVAAQARHVTINTAAIPAYAAALPENALCDIPWVEEWHFRGNDETTIAYILALDSINFGSGYFKHFIKRDGLSGYMTVATALKEFFAKSPPSAAQLASMDAVHCAAIFEQDITTPEMAELMTLFAGALNELGAYIQQHYNGSFCHFVTCAKGSAVTLTENLGKMPLFHDVAQYRSMAVPIYKRAQIAAADLYLCFGGETYGAFSDIGALTIFADNAVPHVLRCEGILTYTPKLADRIDGEELLDAGSEEEVELRACAIHAVELIIQALRALGNETVIPMNIDHYIWHASHDDKYRIYPKHRTKTGFY